MSIAVSATLAASEALSERADRGLPVTPTGFGEVGLPVHPALRDILIQQADQNAYGPVAGVKEIRSAAAGYWQRRGLDTTAGQVIAGPGSKPLLYVALHCLGGDVVLTAPSWVSYAVQVQMNGADPIFVPASEGQGGAPDPEAFEDLVVKARSVGRRIRTLVVTPADNPTGAVTSPEVLSELARIAREHEIMIISDEIYRDVVHGPHEMRSPAEFAEERTVVITGLSKSLAVGGWRTGVARFPDSPQGQGLYRDVLGVASEVWSSPSVPVQQAAAYALHEPDELVERIAASRRLHGIVVNAVGIRLAASGATFSAPQAAFYLYPDFERARDHLEKLDVHTGPELSQHLLTDHGVGSVPAASFEGGSKSLRLRLATSLLYGDTPEQRLEALEAADPLALPWISDHLDRLSEVFATVTGCSS